MQEVEEVLARMHYSSIGNTGGTGGSGGGGAGGAGPSAGCAGVTMLQQEQLIQVAVEVEARWMW
jgi:hypothetical protein